MNYSDLLPVRRGIPVIPSRLHGPLDSFPRDDGRVKEVVGNMSREELERALAAAIDAESRRGIRWWSGEDMAPIAVRRWSSYFRRHPKVKHPTEEDRALDLAKGLQAHFEPDIPYTPKSEWLHLAKILQAILTSSR